MNLKIGETSAEWAKSSRLNYWYETSTASTNLIAKDNAFGNEVLKTPLTVYFADHQTQGKGRGVNRWINSKENSSLLSSWSFYINSTPAPLLSCFVGLAVFRALNASWPTLPWSLKAPNDIYLSDKKVGGLLLETVSQVTSSDDNNLKDKFSQHRLIVGLGLNIFSHPTVIENASNLFSFLSNKSLSEFEWQGFLDRLLMEFSLCISHSVSQFTVNEKAALLFALNRFPLLTEPYLNLDDQGNLYTATRKISWYEL